MKKILALLVFVTSIAQAQYTVRGTMTPPETKSDWVILYKVEGAKQKFVKHTTTKIEKVNIGGSSQSLGKFEFTLPADTPVGAYRATYRDSGAGFIDFFFNKENVEMVFNPKYPDQSVVFTKSLENKVYREYLEALSLSQRTIDSIQVTHLKESSKANKKAYKKAVSALEDTQEIYEKKSKGMLAYHFIKASANKNPSSILEDTQKYLNSVVENFFENVDFGSKELQNSPFFINRITDFIFVINSADTQELQQKLYKESIEKVMDLSDDKNQRKDFLDYLITRYTNDRNSEIVDWLFNDYYNKLPDDMIDAKFRDEKLALLKATVGRTAPDFSWKEEGNELKLSTLDDGENYLLLFWSTGCSHCLKEVPELYEFMKKHKKTSVIAFGIEHEKFEWDEYIKKLYGWHNVMGTHPESKWENEVVKTYQLTGTPTYFILDKDKKIIAMPNSFKDIKDYFEKGNEEASK